MSGCTHRDALPWTGGLEGGLLLAVAFFFFCGRRATSWSRPGRGKAAEGLWGRMNQNDGTGRVAVENMYESAGLDGLDQLVERFWTDRVVVGDEERPRGGQDRRSSSDRTSWSSGGPERGRDGWEGPAIDDRPV